MPQKLQPYIIDIESSGFGSESYPIEIGVALSHGKKFCSLILPARNWTYWDERAENKHNISRETLETYGRPLHEVATILNELLTDRTVYCDGTVFGQPWLQQLFSASGVERCFNIRSLEMILSERQMGVWHATKNTVVNELGISRRRASLKAMIIQETYFRTLTETL